VPVAVVMGEAIHVPDDAGSSGVLRETTREVMRSVEAQVIRARALAGLTPQPKP